MAGNRGYGPNTFHFATRHCNRKASADVPVRYGIVHLPKGWRAWDFGCIRGRRVCCD